MFRKRSKYLSRKSLSITTIFGVVVMLLLFSSCGG
ncbi:MAG: LPS export ABC transporter periplasmic protein LptC, partial [Bacteroides sp.]